MGSGAIYRDLGQPRVQDNNYEYEHSQRYTSTNNKEHDMDPSRPGDGTYRAGSWALQDDEEEEAGLEGYGGAGAFQQHDYDQEGRNDDDEENPFDLTSGSKNTRGGHQQGLTSTTYTPYGEPPNSTGTAFPALAGVSRRIDFTALASSSRANRGHGAAPDGTTPATVKKSLMPPPTTTRKQTPKRRFAARAGSVSSSSSPTAVNDPDDDIDIGGGKGGKSFKASHGVKATPAEAAAAALSRSTKQAKALKTRSRTGRIAHGAQAAHWDLISERELERELEREVQLEQGFLGVPTPAGVGQGQASGVESEMSPATALVVDTARLQLISPPPEEMLREKRVSGVCCLQVSSLGWSLNSHPCQISSYFTFNLISKRCA